MESQPQNPEFRINPETFTHAVPKMLGGINKVMEVEENTSRKQYAPITFSKLEGIIKCSSLVSCY